MAGLSYALENNTDGLVLIVAGYNDKLPTLLTKIVEKMKNLKVDPQRFKFICEQVRPDSPYLTSTGGLHFAF